MKTATSKLNNYTLLLEEAQEDIRELVKRAYLTYEPFYLTQVKLYQLIDKAIKSINIPRLKQDAYNSLIRFANVQKNIWQSINLSPLTVLFLGLQASKDFEIDKYSTKPKNAVERELRGISSYPTDNKGVPLQKFYRDVWYDNVKPMLDRLTETVALDPNDFTGRNSLRSLAEMEVRYKDHQENIDSLKKQNVKIVQCSAHEDCSERCYPWQKQRLYSLDGTYGTIDGKKYIPLEVATDVWYTTKAGRQYKNGLLGFNCRHYLTEYKGELEPTVSAVKRAIEYSITKKQRELERAVRKKRVEAKMLKGINKKAYEEAKAQAERLDAKYRAFSREHERAFYPMRTKI